MVKSTNVLPYPLSALGNGMNTAAVPLVDTPKTLGLLIHGDLSHWNSSTKPVQTIGEMSSIYQLDMIAERSTSNWCSDQTTRRERGALDQDSS